VPWHWIVLITTTTAISTLVENVGGSALTFTLKKFISDPAAIAFVGSINVAFNFMVAPYVSWKSDRIWTRWGRRLPFMLVGWSLLVVALIAAPLSPSLWILIIVIIVWQGAMDLGYTGPWSPLFYEIVPSPQRGRAVVIKRAMVWGASLLYNLVLIGQFDAIYNVSLGSDRLGFRITGEQVIYFTAAGCVFLGLLHLLTNVREVEPATHLPPERFSLVPFFKSIFGSRQWLMIYLLLFCNVAMVAGLGQLAPLLITEQFGYTKQKYGEMTFLTGIISLVVALPLAALIIDRFDRFRIFQVGIFFSTVHPLAYWFYVKYVTTGGVPTPVEIICWEVANRVIDSLGALALEPLVFDLTPKDKMGTMNSGFALVQGLLRWVTLAGVGVWVKYTSVWFAPPGQFDYMSGYLYVAMLGTIGCAGSVYFAHQRRKGAVVTYGVAQPGSEAAKT
jgi:Na+/melibiose symporter-like transporter